MRLDLHLHSTASDGQCSPARVVERAFEARLDVVALADHDTTSGVAEASKAAAELPIEVIPALEASSTWDGHDIHVLGYFVEPDAPALVRSAEAARVRREERMQEMLDLLEEIGIEIPFEAVRRAAGDEVLSYGRPHLARALVAEGHAESVPDAFRLYIGDDGPAFVPTDVQSPAEAVELIRDAGGVAVWAHPPMDRIEGLLPVLADAGLRGLEAYRPNHSPSQVEALLRWSQRYDLVVTGGSDWHGPDRGPELGAFWVTPEEVASFLEMSGM